MAGELTRATTYNNTAIEVLPGLEGVRRRPGMYIGGVDRAAMHHLLWEVVGNAIDEHRAGHGNEVRIAIDGDAITVEDRGRGIPIDPVPKRHMSVLECVMTTLLGGSGSKYRRGHVHLTSSFRGVGIAVVNALCERLDVDVWRAGRHHAQSYTHGVARPLRDLGATDRTGLRVRFIPDFTIFDRSTWDRDAIAERLREIAAMAPRATLALDGEEFRCPDGLAGLVRHHAPDGVRPTQISGTLDGIAVDVAVAWTATRARVVHGFVGMTRAFGTHTQGLDDALRGVPRERGLLAIVHVSLLDPRFGNPSRDWLTNPEVRTAVRTIVGDQLRER